MNEMKFTWKQKNWWNSSSLESVPKVYFIARHTRRGIKRTMLFKYDASPQGYSIVSYCDGLRHAKKLAQEDSEKQS